MSDDLIREAREQERADVVAFIEAMFAELGDLGQPTLRYVLLQPIQRGDHVGRAQSEPSAGFRGDAERRKMRIAEIATEIVASKMANGEIEQSEEAIRKAMPAAVKLAREAYDAAEEYLS
jgi:hypothetical protein